MGKDNLAEAGCYCAGADGAAGDMGSVQTGIRQ
jgi:hypothetical protein